MRYDNRPPADANAEQAMTRTAAYVVLGGVIVSALLMVVIVWWFVTAGHP